ncbi:copper resistance CopC family protein [Streptomyces sp. NPDC005423]|uniref:copper resistance CopC/CopD family protein n=1 Tax=Streptomyces sp. NPDC005423 TaxID=3155343 RepID=UPI0033AB7024
MLLGSLLVLFLLGTAAPASAHAALVGTTPADGSVVTSAPRSVTLTFSESVGLLDDSFRVFDPANRRVRTGPARHARTGADTASVTLPADLGTGTFTVAWRVVSADSHPVAGAFTFSIGKPSPTTVPLATSATEDPLTGGLYDIARYLAYVAAALLIGTVTFVTLCRPADPTALHKPVLTGWWTLLAATLALLVLRAPYETGTGPGTAFAPSSLTHTLTTRPGLALAARLALLALTGPYLLRLRARPRPGRPTLAAGAALAVGLALTWAAAEHASAGIQVPVAMASAVLHLLAMAVWLGGLTALLTLLHRAPDLDSAPVARFSRLAFASVTVLVVTGAYQSWRGLGSWHALTTTSYGRVLLVKLAAVLVLLAVAGRSRRWTGRMVAEAAGAGACAETAARVPVPVPVTVLTEAVPAAEAARQDGRTERVPEAVSGRDAQSQSQSQSQSQVQSQSGPESESESGDTGAATDSGRSARRRLRRSVLLEVAVGVAVLVITTLLTNTLPGRAAAEAAPAAGTGVPAASVTTIPFDVGTPGVHGRVQITLDPGRVGRNTVEAVVYGADGGFATVPELRLSFTLPAQKIGPIDARLADRGGYWAGDTLNLPIPGTWTMKATIRVSDLDQVSEEKRVRIPR